MISTKIISLKKTDSYKNIQSVTLPTYSGQVQILPGHAEAFFAIQAGKITLRQKEGEEKNLSTQGGFAHIQDDNLIILS